MYFEIFLGFWFILILSDNLHLNDLGFAKSFKDVYIVLMALIFYLDRKKFRPLSNLYKPFLWFYGVSFFCLIFSPIIFTGLEKNLSHFLLFLIIPQYTLLCYRERGEVFFKDLVYFGITVILVSYLWQFVNPNFVYLLGKRFRGIFGNPNGVGVFITVLAVLFMISREVFKELYSKKEVLFILVVIAFSAYLCESRTAIFSIALLLLLNRFFKLSPFLGILIFLALGFGAEIISSNIVQIIDALDLGHFFRVSTIQGASGRYVAWHFAWQKIQQSIIFGKGFGYDEWMMIKNQFILNQLGHQGGVHNSFLSLWLNSGVFGLFFFLRAYVLSTIKGAKLNHLAVPAVLTFSFSLLYESWIVASLNPFTIGFVICLTLLTEREFYPVSEEVEPSENELKLENNEAKNTLPIY